MKQKLSLEEYFKGWSKEDVSNLTDLTKEEIYQKYVMKIEVLERDDYTCQNVNCKYCNNVKNHPKLTVHHYKAKRNGGANKGRNGVTLCQGSHNALNRGKTVIKYSNNSKLPAHIRGSTQIEDDEPQINWKEVRAKMKVRRKEFRNLFGVPITSNQMEILMKFLYKMFEENI